MLNSLIFRLLVTIQLIKRTTKRNKYIHKSFRVTHNDNTNKTKKKKLMQHIK